MKTSARNALIVFPIFVMIGFLVAWAGSQVGSRIAGIPVFALLVGLAFLIQWLAYIPANLMQTERFNDLTGSRSGAGRYRAIPGGFTRPG